jgi:pseudoazurin
MRKTIAAALAGAIALGAGAAAAEEHVVQMLNRNDDGDIMVFEPPVLRIQPGDTVVFESTNPGHNSQSIEGLIPEGGESWKGGINQEVSVTLETPGAYAYKCLPHYGTGMVGIIIVGDDASGLDAIAEESMPGRAGQRMEQYVEQARSMM